MADLSKPTGYVGRIAYAQRLVKSAQFRTDPKLAVRELCEALGEVLAALQEREQGQQSSGGQPDPGKPPPS
jgi:hypothetical protein